MLVIFVLSVVVIPKIRTAEAESRTLIVPDNYPTIASAIGNATDGDTIFVKNGTHDGPVNQTLVIDKSISIVGDEKEGVTIKLRAAYNVTWILTTALYRYSDSLIINAKGVSILNLTLNVRGSIRAHGDNLQILGSNIETVDSFFTTTGANCTLADNLLSNLYLKGSSNIIKQNRCNDLELQSSHSNIITSNVFQYLTLSSSHNNTIDENIISAGAASYAVKIKNSHNNRFDNNNITRVSLSNSNNNNLVNNNITTTPYAYAINIDNSNSSIFYSNTIANVEIGYPSNNNTFFGNSFVGSSDDDNPLVRIGWLKTVSNSWDNGSIGNCWIDYLAKYPNASEISSSGIGDTPYVISPSHEGDPIAYIDRFPLFPSSSQEVSKETEQQEPQQPKPLSPTVIVTSAAILVLIAAVLLGYFKKHKMK
jgi:hypothetical protein